MNQRDRLRRLIASETAWFVVYVIIVVASTTICFQRRCNNFLIFRAAFDHLLAGRNMYVLHPDEHADLFKYSPTFALLFAPLARLPFGAALLLWNALNVLPLFVALRLVLPVDQRLGAIQLTALGLIATVDGSQSNGLIAALLLLAFAAFERDRVIAAAAAIAAGALIKLFPLAAAAFAVPRADRWRFAAAGLTIGALAVGAPLLVTNASTLVDQYHAWYRMGAVDALDRGASVMALLHLAVGYDGPNWPVQLAATLMLILPLAQRPSRWGNGAFRRQLLASLCVYAVIFNHKAEQPSFVIAVIGMAVWYTTLPKSAVRTVVTGSTFVSTVPILIAVAAPKLFMGGVQTPLLATSACCTVAWLMMQAELLDLVPVPRAGRQLSVISDEPAV